ncbi:uncharacterized protein [Aristolochia californica]|uniref:uncharacterized protein n=1 Tax=Aristolochia californica TaxID=171875 RepID=UPI0035E03C48
MGFDFKVEYNLGRHNRGADALYRRDLVDPQLHAISQLLLLLLDSIREDIQSHPELLELYQKFEQGTSDHQWEIQDGLILYKKCLFIHHNSPLLTAIIAVVHNSTHEGQQKTYFCTSRDFYWKGLKRMVADYVLASQVCQRDKTDSLHPAGLLQPLQLPSQVWAAISMDFIEGLPTSSGKSVILVVVDRFSKYGHFLPLAHPYTAAQGAHLVMEQIVRLHGLPKSITCDRDAVFTSTFWKDLFKLLGTKLAFSSAYHPQSDGQTEVVNRTLEIYLRCFVGDHPKCWALGERDTMLAQVKSNLQKAQATMKHYYDKRHRDLSFAPGDLCVVVYSALPVALTDCNTEEQVAYHLQLPPDTRIHDVFRVSLLKPFCGDSPMFYTPLPPLHDGRALPSPAQVLQARRIHESWELLLQWAASESLVDSWEPLEELRDRYPNFELEDKLFLQSLRESWLLNEELKLETLDITSSSRDTVAIVDAVTDSDLWHRLGHMSEKGMKVLQSKEKLPRLKTINNSLCEGCIFSKHKWVNFSKPRKEQKTTKLELVHTNVWGPSVVTSLGSSNYYVIFIDDASKKVWVYFLKTKSDVFDTFKR